MSSDQITLKTYLVGVAQYSSSELTPDQLDHKVEHRFLDTDEETKSLTPWDIWPEQEPPSHTPVPATAAKSASSRKEGLECVDLPYSISSSHLPSHTSNEVISPIMS